MNPNNPQQLFLGVTNFGVFISDDGGASFTLRNFGLRNPRTFNSTTTGISFDANDPNRVYLATRAGLFSSPDLGQHWCLLNESGLFIFEFEFDLSIGSILQKGRDVGEESSQDLFGLRI